MLITRMAFAALMVAAAVAAAIVARQDPVVKFSSADECVGAHGEYRWDVKTDHEAPPDTIATGNKIRPSDVAAWPAPRGTITETTPRSGREKDWFEVTGKLVLARAEPDGDIHMQLVDADGVNKVNVIAEVPVKQRAGDSPWLDIRTKVFGWTTAAFPFNATTDKTLHLNKNPVIRVEGKAFFDAKHAKKVDGVRTNRRLDAAEGEELSVWEIHPVMVLDVIGGG